MAKKDLLHARELEQKKEIGSTCTLERNQDQQLHLTELKQQIQAILGSVDQVKAAYRGTSHESPTQSSYFTPKVKQWSFFPQYPLLYFWSYSLALRTRMTRSLSKNLITSYENPEQKFRSSRKLIRTRSLDRLDSPESNLFSNYVDQFEEEETETMRGPTMEEYMTKTRDDYGSGIVMHKIDDKALFKLKHQFLKELQDNTFSGSDNENANEHTKKLLEIVDLFHIPEVTQDQIMLRVFPMSLTGAASRWLKINQLVQ
ncbi:hypothetical protein Tco_1241718 [Tanacetum coccineum]